MKPTFRLKTPEQLQATYNAIRLIRVLVRELMQRGATIEECMLLLETPGSDFLGSDIFDHIDPKLEADDD